MITALYASLCALFIVKLSLGVIAVRRQHKIGLGDGGNEELQLAIRAQGNATEYIPITLILMLLLENIIVYNWMIHLAGITLLTGRIIHAIGIKNHDLKKRVLGMKITLYLIIALSILNIVYFALAYLMPVS
ncbi:MAPEG family protein [Methylophaga sp.]|uniref:MAPEG family protein n=1 Tax=Methylophaga sp. TaxID=2024840 RepID=UPI003A9492AD